MASLTLGQEQELDELRGDLKRMHDIEDKLPPGDRRAAVKKIADRVREMVCEAEGAMNAGRDTTNITARIHNLIKTIIE